MTEIRNTSEHVRTGTGALEFLAEALFGGGSSAAIVGMEAQGQAELVASEQLPVDSDGEDDQFRALGFTFGEPTPGDPIFRSATLPEGWRREASDHHMWSHIVDTLGRRRVAIFYKAAFYDRHANMDLVSPRGYLRQCLDAGTDPVLDDTWLTAAVADAALVEMRDEGLARAQKDEMYAAEDDRSEDNRQWLRRYAQEQRDEAAKVEALRVRIAGGAR